MPQAKKHSAEQIIGKLREAEVEISKGQTIGQSRQEAGDHGADVLPLAQGVRRPADRPGQAAQGAGEGERPAEEVVANQALDMEILKEAASGNF